MRLIDADHFDEALKNAQNECRKTGGNFRFGFLSTVRANLEAAPTIDAVCVVRCKDCAHPIMRGDNRYCKQVAMYVPDEWYCATGKRREASEDDEDETD